MVEPQAILERKVVKHGSRHDAKWLIHWKDSSSADATWEWANEI